MAVKIRTVIWSATNPLQLYCYYYNCCNNYDYYNYSYYYYNHYYNYLAR